MSIHFSEKFCDGSGIVRDDYLDVIFARAAFPHVRHVKCILERLDPYFFAADYDFISSVGRALKPRDFDFAAEEFAEHPHNRRFLRRFLRVRVSQQRFERLFREVWQSPVEPSSQGATGAGFDSGPVVS